jgi:hypothetical protein
MKILYDKEYRELEIKQTREQILYLLKNSVEFSIVVNMDETIQFNPPLPEEIMASFNEFTIFAIAGYTFTSSFIDSDTFVFEAGFGKQNIGSVVRVDLDRILQIIIGEHPIFINVIATIAKQQPKDSTSVFMSKKSNQEKFFKH